MLPAETQNHQHSPESCHSGERCIERQCVTCRKFFDRSTLLRTIRSSPNTEVQVFLPLSTPKNVFGRSAYVCFTETCLKAALKGKRLQRALKTPFPDAIVLGLETQLKELSSRGHNEKTN